VSKTTDWRRLFVEGAAVVASILLAFAIDAAWGERDQREQARERVAAVEAELTVFITQLEAEVVSLRRVEEAAQFALGSIAAGSASTTLPDTVLAALLFIPGIDPPLTAARTALEEGALVSLGRATMADSLSGWPEWVASQRANERETFRFVVEELTPHLREAAELSGVFPIGRPWLDGSLPEGWTSSVVQVSGSLELRNLLAERLFNATLSREDYEALRARATRLRDMLSEGSR
jgi:hypothetical protein